MANSSLEFDFRVVGDGRSAIARYANNSNYRNDSLIRKESTWSAPNCAVLLGGQHIANSGPAVYVSSIVIEEIKQIIKLSEITKCVQSLSLRCPVRADTNSVWQIGRTMRSGPRRTRTAGKNSSSESATNTSRSRRPRSGPSST